MALDLRERPGAVEDAHTQALFEEAYRRRKRRRRVTLVTVALIGFAAAVAHGVSGGGRGAPSTGPHADGGQADVPAVNGSAFSHHGELAFVSRGSLWILDGSSSSLRRVDTPGLVPSAPSFSPDGRWLAFMASEERPACCYGRLQVVSSELWIAKGNGRDPHQLTGLAFHSVIGWNPRRDLLAVTVGKAATAPYGVATGIDLITPAGGVRRLLSGSHVWGGEWSPEGSALAASSEVPAHGSDHQMGLLSSYTLGSASPTVWTESDGVIVPLGWWRGWGVIYATVTAGGVPGGSASADGSNLYALSGPSAQVLLLGRTLENAAAGAPTVSARGALAYVATHVSGGEPGRDLWSGKQVVVCTPAPTRCAPVPHPATNVTLDPAWAPDGATLSYVEAPAVASVPGPSLPGWYDAHRLVLYQPSDGEATAAAGRNGASVPDWAKNGKSLLYVAHNGLWMATSPARRPVEVAWPLFAPPWASNSYYGQVPFAAQFSWSASV